MSVEIQKMRTMTTRYMKKQAEKETRSVTTRSMKKQADKEESEKKQTVCSRQRKRIRRSTNTKKNKKKPVNIPNDLIVEVLLRVPGSSLLRFRLVSKFFDVTIRDPAFRDSHLDHAEKSLHMIALSRQRRSCTVKKMTLLDEAMRTKSISGNIPLDHEGYNISVSSCNGFVCVYDDVSHVRLLNLTTREQLVLPEATPNRASSSSSRPACVLGFSRSRKEYKVVRLVEVEKDVVLCEVLTVGTSSWREVCYLSKFPYDRDGVESDGVIYYLKGWEEVWSFDLREETFSLIPFRYATEEHRMPKLLTAVGVEGGICLAADMRKPSYAMDIWAMGDATHGVWDHRWRVSLHSVFQEYTSRCLRPFSGADPLLLYKDKLILHANWKVFSFDLESEKESYDVLYEQESFGYEMQAHVYVESLISLGGGGSSSTKKT